jgi:hypothetical protein
MLASQHLAGNYQYPNLSYFFRSALHAYQTGSLVLTYQRQNNPRKEITFCLTEKLFNFYNSLPARSKAEILASLDILLYCICFKKVAKKF